MNLKYMNDIRACIGKRVYWDERDSARYYGRELSGILEDAAGKNIMINGDWKWKPNLLNLRDTSKHEELKEKS